MDEASHNSSHPLAPHTPNHAVDGAADTDPGPSRSSGSQRKRAPLTSVACQACRKRKTKCDGGKPVCKNCAKRGTTACAYDLEPNQSRVAAYKQKIERQISTIKALEEEIRRLKLPPRSDSVEARSSISEPCSSVPNTGGGVPLRLLLNPAPEPQGLASHDTQRLPAPDPAPPPIIQDINREAELLTHNHILEAENRTLKELVLLLNFVDNREVAQDMADEICVKGVSDDLLARAQHLSMSQTRRNPRLAGPNHVEAARRQFTFPPGYTRSLP